MSLSRNDSRVLAMIILYQVDLFNKRNISYKLDDLIHNNTVDIDGDISFIRELVLGVINNEDRLKNIANKYLKQWNIDRLGLTDGAILKIAIDEAVELAKDFSDEKVVGMINAVLDSVYHIELEGRDAE